MIIIETCPRCGNDLRDVCICTYPPIPRKECPSCGWFWEGEPEQVVRVPFVGKQPVVNEYGIDWLHRESSAPRACASCPNHPSNGGSGICHCTLGNTEIIY